MSLEGQRLGAALAAENARRATYRISHTSFTCVVSGANLTEMGEAALKACQAYFLGNPFEITDLDAEQTPATEVRVGETFETQPVGPVSYIARVRARAI